MAKTRLTIYADPAVPKRLHDLWILRVLRILAIQFTASMIFKAYYRVGEDEV